MLHFQNIYPPAQAAGQNGGPQQAVQMDWSAEVTPATVQGGQMPQQFAQGSVQNAQMPGQISQPPFLTVPMQTGLSAAAQLMTDGAQLDMRNDLPDEVIQNPLTVNEAHMGSLKAMLARNVGNFIVATFLVGTQGTVSWEGILYDVGNDYVTIYQAGRDRYIVSDIYSLKYIEFYDTERRAVCEELLRENGWQRRQG